jgi:hypothetical protein
MGVGARFVENLSDHGQAVLQVIRGDSDALVKHLISA